MVHEKLPPQLRLLHDDGWQRFLARLCATAAGTDPGEYPGERPDERLRTLRHGESRSCRWTSPPPHGKGSTYDQVAGFLGRENVSSFRVLDHEPERRVRITTTRSPFPITETRIVEPLGADRSRVIAVVEGDAGGSFRIAGPLLRPLVARSVRGDYGVRLRTQLQR